jgi:hypothetical protein
MKLRPTFYQAATVLAIAAGSLGATSGMASAQEPECARIMKMISGYWNAASEYAGRGDWRGFNNQMTAVNILSEGYSDKGC